MTFKFEFSGFGHLNWLAIKDEKLSSMSRSCIILFYITIIWACYSSFMWPHIGPFRPHYKAFWTTLKGLCPPLKGPLALSTIYVEICVGDKEEGKCGQIYQLYQINTYFWQTIISFNHKPLIYHMYCDSNGKT